MNIKNEKGLSPREKELMTGAYLIGPEKADGWFYLHIEGEPYQRGFQHGFLLGKELRKYIDTNSYEVKFDTGNDFSFFVQAAERMWLDRVDDEFLAEVQGIADGATCAGYPVTLAEVLAWNGFEELTDYWWPLAFSSSSQNFIPRKNSQHCSGFIASGDVTADGKTLMAHETWDTYLNGTAQKLILDIKPAKGNRILMQSCIGHIDSSSDFFITRNGIMGTETTIGGGFQGYNENGAPEFFRVRKAMQYAESIDHWIFIMGDQNNGGVANSWLLGNCHSTEIVRFELGLKFSSVERKNSGAFFGENVPTDPGIRNQECSDTQLYYDIRDSGARRVRWIQLMGDLDNPNKKAKPKPGIYKKVDVETAKKMLGDHFDVYIQQQNGYGPDDKRCSDHPCGHTICSHLDLDPANPMNHAGQPPFYPWGSVDGKVVSTDLAKDMKFWARRGHPCGMSFNAAEFLEKHPQYNWLEGYLEDMPGQEWHLCMINEKSPSGNRKK
jgi:hypothetical protein